MQETFPSLLAQAAPVFDRMMPQDIIPVVAITLGIGGGVLIALTAIIVGNWRKVRDRKLVASLIQDMLDRNMTAGRDPAGHEHLAGGQRFGARTRSEPFPGCRACPPSLPSWPDARPQETKHTSSSDSCMSPRR